MDHVIVFPAIIAVTKGCVTATANEDENNVEHNQVSFDLAVIEKPTQEEIKMVLFRSLTENNWRVTAHNKGSLSAKRNAHDSRESLTITYDTECITIEDCSGGSSTAPDTPSESVKALINQIQKNLLDGLTV